MWAISPSSLGLHPSLWESDVSFSCFNRRFLLFWLTEGLPSIEDVVALVLGPNALGGSDWFELFDCPLRLSGLGSSSESDNSMISLTSVFVTGAGLEFRIFCLLFECDADEEDI